MDKQSTQTIKEVLGLLDVFLIDVKKTIENPVWSARSLAHLPLNMSYTCCYYGHRHRRRLLQGEEEDRELSTLIDFLCTG